ADRQLYRAYIRRTLENQANLKIFQQSVDDLIVQDERVTGVVTDMGLRFAATSIVLTVGTFLGGIIHVGMDKRQGGRAGDAASNRLADRLRELPFSVGRLKTGTPPRIDGNTVDFSFLEEQPGDEPRPVMSYLSSNKDHPRQVSCFITHTNENTHDLIRAGLDRSPLYTGKIDGVGPRYCPSIEDKIVRFDDKSSHQIFIEPEGLDTVEIYPNGISTSLPFDVQQQFVRSIKGFEVAHITRPGYAIEYDFFEPRDLKNSLETRHLSGLYFAGQINGTTGYEEAAAQGLIAGINAARAARGDDAWCPRRNEAYMGVLVDDLITMGTTEPYRMFTSRAEHRILLRQDNADSRLTPLGAELGLVGSERVDRMERKQKAMAETRRRIEEKTVTPGQVNAYLESVGTSPLVRPERLSKIALRPEVKLAKLLNNNNLRDVFVPKYDGPESIETLVEIDLKYRGYLERERETVEKMVRLENMEIPSGIDYSKMDNISMEAREKLSKIQPSNLGQASRISGVSPADVSVLMVLLKKWSADPVETMH
ncbi:MAG: tRNA uridine-5-carboxymethylaminomethyl(34) synthesis enzyme MnmG, partial [Bacteroidetes bacterium]|nr:tRNA uridine-5-carboxymethylaminomethyl(34) synthesis enzyme MnmG [Bacteroidota bacterium]